MTCLPLGDQAVLAYLPDEPAAIRFAAAVRRAQPSWLQDVVPAYASVGVFFDADAVRLTTVLDWLNTLVVPNDDSHASPSTSHVIPVCYEMGPDLARVAELTHQNPERVIAAHLSREYTVFAIGFVPGFPYLGYLPDELAGVPRLASPRVRVEAGSVGLAGKQTGLYPLPRPGGWNLIGRTPLTVVDVAGGFFPLRVGDRVRFERINESRFRQLEGQRLA